MHRIIPPLLLGGGPDTEVRKLMKIYRRKILKSEIVVGGGSLWASVDGMVAERLKGRKKAKGKRGHEEGTGLGDKGGWVEE